MSCTIHDSTVVFFDWKKHLDADGLHSVTILPYEWLAKHPELQAHIDRLVSQDSPASYFDQFLGASV